MVYCKISTFSVITDPMWAIVTVVEESTIAITNQLSHFNELGTSIPQLSMVASQNPFILQHRLHLENNQVITFLR